MEPHDELTILSESEESYISKCSCCEVINLVYRNIAIKLNEKQFHFFKNYMNELNTSDFHYKSRTGKNIFMATPAPSIVFCFQESEMEALRSMLNEASLMLEIKSILN